MAEVPREPLEPRPEDEDRAARPALPDRATIGLLDLVTATSLDEDYAHVSEQRRRAGPDRPSDSATRRLHPLALLALLMFGVLLAMAGVETARNANATAISKDSLVTQVQDRREELNLARAQVEEIRTDIAALQRDNLEATAEGRRLQALLGQLGAATGASAVQGPGVRIVVDDAPRAASQKEIVLDTDLQRLVNGLWASGAEAIAINGHRLTNLVAIRTAGDAITVGKSLTRPYVIDAIGDPEQLPARFIESDGGTWWLNLQSVYQMQFQMTSEDTITVPAAPNLRLRLADQPGTGR